MVLDTDAHKSELSGYRWVVLLINWFIVFFVYGSWLFIVVIFQKIPFLEDNDWLQNIIYVLPFIGLICMGLPAGGLIDKYGLKRIGFIGLFIVTLSTFCRGLSYDFVTLALSSIVLGFGVGLIIPIGNKLISMWFGEKEMGTASGITVMAAGLGIAVSQSITILLLMPWLGSAQNLFYFFAFCNLLMLILWNFIKEKPTGSIKRDRVPLREALSKIMHNKYVWILSLVNLIILAIFYTTIKAPIFKNILVDESLAGLAISLVSYGAMISNVLMPILSDRFRNRRTFLFLAFLFLVPSLILVNYLGASGVWILSFAIGFLVGTITPLVLVIPIELKGVGHSYVAGATGLITVIGKIGALTFPLIYLLITTISDAGMGFVFLAIFSIIAILLVKLLPETAGKAGESDTKSG